MATQSKNLVMYLPLNAPVLNQNYIPNYLGNGLLGTGIKWEMPLTDLSICAYPLVKDFDGDCIDIIDDLNETGMYVFSDNESY